MLNDWVVLGDLPSENMAKNISKNLNIEFKFIDVTTFNDGEIKIRIDGDLSKKKCILVQSLFPDVNNKFIQLLMILFRLKQDNTTLRNLVIPYLAYARQDKMFLPGEAVTIKMMADLLNFYSLDNFITVDIHNISSLSFFKCNTINISAIPYLANYFSQKYKLKDCIVISPDIGGRMRAEHFASFGNVPVYYLNKTRNRLSGEVKIEDRLDFDVCNKDIIIVDDMISTGSSIVKASKILKENGANKIYVACTHALLLDNAMNKIKQSGVIDIISTNSIPNECSKVDLSDAITKSMQI